MPFEADIHKAAARLRAGGVVAFPTETVYGLGADASNSEAVSRIFSIKGRPPDHPLIVHIGDARLMENWARDVPIIAHRLAESFWPGPLTMILSRGSAPLAVTGGQDSVGLRMPDHPVAMELLRQFGGGIAAPSANRFGRISPTRPEHVLDELGDTVDIILDGGGCRVGLESTIVSLVNNQPMLLRPGAISQSELEAIAGIHFSAHGSASGIRVSGGLESHYAPETRLSLCPAENIGLLISEQKPSRKIAVMHHTTLDDRCRETAAHVHPMPVTASAYGQALYATLRLLDQQDFDLIIVEQPPQDESWSAINDRLRKASHGSGD